MDLRYIAGFFDGEGCIDVKPGSRYAIKISNKNREVLEMIQECVGFGKIYYHKAGFWTYETTNMLDTYTFLILIRPYLIVKAAKADQAIKILEEKLCRSSSHAER